MPNNDNFMESILATTVFLLAFSYHNNRINAWWYISVQTLG